MPRQQRLPVLLMAAATANIWTLTAKKRWVKFNFF
jgi:hypothetical protein